MTAADSEEEKKKNINYILVNYWQTPAQPAVYSRDTCLGNEAVSWMEFPLSVQWNLDITKSQGIGKIFSL